VKDKDLRDARRVAKQAGRCCQLSAGPANYSFYSFGAASAL